MSVKRARTYVIGTLLLVAVVMAATLTSGNEPVLGLDLQGGVSVVYSPVGKFKPGALDVAVEIIRSRADGFGASEAEINRQGDTIAVDLPGVKNRAKALRIVGRTAELRFRPVLAVLPPLGKQPSTTTTSSTTTTPGSTAPGQTTTTAPATTTTTTAPANAEAIKAAIASCDPNQVVALAAAGTEIPNSGRADDKRKACVVLPSRATDGSPAERVYLGPTRLRGNDVDSGKSRFSQGQGYAVDLSLKDSGQQKFNKLAGESFPKSPPQNRVAIVLDGRVQSSPAFETPTFDNNVQITGSFTPSEAEDLATIINYGALPVQLKQLTVQNVAPTLGRDQLDAGIAAGLIGLLLVAGYMILYYRLLGLVAVVGLLISGALTYALVSYLGTLDHPVVLTLAGVTGLIVSIGVTVDSYVVYFERLKDEVKTGKTVRSSVDRGFVRSFKTIVAADLVSLIGAAALYFIAVGSVRGFAFFLGISTLLDLLVSYFFMHPLVSLMARRPELVRMRGIGIAAGLDAPGVAA